MLTVSVLVDDITGITNNNNVTLDKTAVQPSWLSGSQVGTDNGMNSVAVWQYSAVSPVPSQPPGLAWTWHSSPVFTATKWPQPLGRALTHTSVTPPYIYSLLYLLFILKYYPSLYWCLKQLSLPCAD